MADKFKTSISLDFDVYEQIKILAEKDDRNFSQYVNKILKEHILRVQLDVNVNKK